jgi:hypothetical protein
LGDLHWLLSESYDVHRQVWCRWTWCAVHVPFCNRT